MLPADILKKTVVAFAGYTISPMMMTYEPIVCRSIAEHLWKDEMQIEEASVEEATILQQRVFVFNEIDEYDDWLEAWDATTCVRLLAGAAAQQPLNVSISMADQAKKELGTPRSLL